MVPRIAHRLLAKLRDCGQPSPWKCKPHLRRGRTVYNVEITCEGDIAKVDERPIYAESDISFSVAAIEDVTPS